jgi:surface polysaccharide O-acyltransferase-like enzyme
MLNSKTLHNSSPLRVPTFYAPSVINDESCVLVAICVAVAFGGIHLVAWSFQFPSLQERLAWRISATFVFVIPLFFVASGMLIQNALVMDIDQTVYGLTVIYIMARIVLLILPCIALRALPASAFVDIQWTSFSPHVG